MQLLEKSLTSFLLGSKEFLKSEKVQILIWNMQSFGLYSLGYGSRGQASSIISDKSIPTHKECRTPCLSKKVSTVHVTCKCSYC